MQLLIIGSKGFIGSALTGYLRSASVEVYEADIVQEYGNANYIQIDPNASDFEFDELFKLREFEACINCSGAALVSNSFDNPLLDYRLNTVNVYRMLNSIRLRNPACRFITLSSAAVYGNPQSLPISENHPLNPMSPYGFHKMQAEQVCEYFSKHYHISTIVLRIFSAYGPGLKKQLFWDLFQKFQKHTESIQLFGDGEETRDFIYIEDLCRLIQILLEKELSKFSVFNVGGGKQVRIKEVVSTFYELLGFSGKVEFSNQLLPGYPSQWEADISAISKLGFKPQTDIKKGLSDYLAWLKDLK